MSDETLKIECWSDNNANIHSTRKDEFEIDRAEWAAMTRDERLERVREELLGNEHFDFGFDDPLEADHE